MKEDIRATLKAVLAEVLWKERVPSAAEIARKREAIERSERESAYAVTVHDQSLKPIFDALSALPEKAGKKFHVATFGRGAATSIEYGLDESNPELADPSRRESYERIRQLYTLNISVSACERDGIFSRKLSASVYVEGYAGDKSPLSLTGAGQVIGRWLNKTAPERADEVKAALKPLKL